MAPKQSTNTQATGHATANPTDPQTDALRAEEAAWFFGWVKSAGLYLAIVTAYLAAAAGLVAAWQKFMDPPTHATNLTTYILCLVLLLPLLFALLFNVLPAMRRRWERNSLPTGVGAEDYFDTAPREEDKYDFFGPGYDAYVNWAGQPKAPLLHLTGLSGTGKSSLLAACIKPRLAHPKSEDNNPVTHTIVIRSYDDPLGRLKKELLTFWKSTPADYNDLGPLDALRRAARQLGQDKSLLIAFDQFEEFFILRATDAEPATAADVETAQASEADVAPLRNFLQGFLGDPPANVTLLLVYREDHRRLLTPLGLPARIDGKNSMTVDPLDFAAARRFLENCPGLKVPKNRMQLVLREATRYEGGRVIMRPIVANLLGLILRKMSGHPTLWRQTTDLLRTYVRNCLGQETAEERAKVLRPLLTDFHTARPRPAHQIALEAKVKPTVLDGHLEHLGRAGLLRCVNRDESDAENRVWQISHDFLATLIDRAVVGVHQTFWRNVRPWVAPTAVLVLLALLMVLPAVQKHQAILTLNSAGFNWDEETRTLKATAQVPLRIKNLTHVADAVQGLNPIAPDLSFWFELESLDGVQGLTALQSLNLSWCKQVSDVSPLAGLTALQSLDLSGTQVSDVAPLAGLTALRSLDLSRTQVTAAQRAKMRAALPYCKIF